MVQRPPKGGTLVVWQVRCSEYQLLTEDATPSATRQWRDMAARKLPELDQHIAQTPALRQAVADCLECGCMKFDQCVLLDTERYALTYKHPTATQLPGSAQ
ncbi:hypothetical protein [Streptomyces sp. NPDC002540]